jgi:hypothetical protein
MRLFYNPGSGSLQVSKTDSQKTCASRPDLRHRPAPADLRPQTCAWVEAPVRPDAATASVDRLQEDIVGARTKELSEQVIVLFFLRGSGSKGSLNSLMLWYYSCKQPRRENMSCYCSCKQLRLGKKTCKCSCKQLKKGNKSCTLNCKYAELDNFHFVY